MDRLKQIILNRYPSVNITYFNDVASGCNNFKQQLLLIEKLCKDQNTIVIIERSNNIRFNKLAQELIGELDSTSLNDYCFILLRGPAKAIAMNWLHELQYIVKHVLCPMKSECGICYNYIVDEATCCYHCKTMFCMDCAQHLYDTTSYFCPYCCNHLIFPELCKPSGDYHEYLEYVIRELMEPATIDGKVRYDMCVIALPPHTIDMLCKLGASRNNNFDEVFLERMANSITTCKIPTF